MSKVKLEDLLGAGCHFGHLTSRWNPKMKPFIFMEKNGIHVLDLKKTSDRLTLACNEIEKIASKGGTLLYVGTKKQAQDLIETEASRSNNFYVKERWLGGTLTNFATVRKSVRKLKGLEKKGVDGTYEKISKKEILDIERQRDKMSKVLGGIAGMKRIPTALFVIDTNKEQIAILEAVKLKVPIIAIVDTNSDPTLIDYPIPANDDASKSIAIITKTITEAFISGAAKVKAKKAEDEAEAPKKVSKVKEKKEVKKEVIKDA